MRKHFLILMLMALLPLAGWAVEEPKPLSGYIAQFGTITYNGGEQNLPVPTELKKGESTITEGIEASNWKNAAGQPVTKITDAGTYTCTIQATGYEGTITGTLTVAKYHVDVVAKVTVSAQNLIYFGTTLADVNKRFGATISTAKPSELTNDQWNTQKAEFLKKIAYLTDYEQWADIMTDDETPTAVNFTVTPDITAMEAAFTNYTFEPTAKTFNVTAKNLKKNMSTIKDNKYKASDYTPNKDNGGLTMKDVERSKDMVEGKDYTIAYYKNLNSNKTDVTGSALTTNGLTNVGTYYAKISGAGNYGGYVIAEFHVTQNSLAITTIGKTLTYGDAPAVPALTANDYQGFQGTEDFAHLSNYFNETSGVTNILTKIQNEQGEDVEATKLTNVGTYTVKAYPAKITEEEGSDPVIEALTLGDDEIFTNYKAIFFDLGKYVINQKELTFTLKNYSKKHGTTDPLDNAAGVQITATNYGKYMDALPALVEGDVYSVYPTVKLNADRTKVTIDLSKVKIVREADEEVDVTKNYKLTPTEATFTDAVGQLNVKVVPVTKTYNANRKLATENAALELVIVGGSDADIEYARPRILKAFSISSTSNDEVEANRVAFPNAGTYDITYDEKKLDLGDLKDKYEVEPFPATYTIQKRVINKLTAANLTYAVGEAADAYTPNASNVTITLKEVKDDDYTLTDTDKRILFKEIKFEFTDAASSKYEESEGVNVIKSDASGSVTGGITLNYVDDTKKLTNFELATGENLGFIAGKLIISAAAAEGATLFDRNQVDDATTTNVDESFYAKFVKGNDGKKIDVTFKNFASPLKAQKWNSLVLPFDITVAKLSQAMGYALVYVINKEATTADNIKFQIEMGTIPANTPFLVKTSEEVDMNEVTFEDVVVKKSATNKPSIALTEKGVTFYGLYIAKSGLTANERTVSNDTWITNNSKATLLPLAAYLETANANARVFVEDIDEDGTTAIKELDMNTMSVKAVDGWYTLNGVKLQGMPTEKGIYINNGKKVVIK